MLSMLGLTQRAVARQGYERPPKPICLVRTNDQRCEAIKRACEETMLNLDPLEAGMSIARGRVEDAVRHGIPGIPAA